MKSPVTVKLRKLADAELAYRRLRDDVFALSSVNPATVASLASMRRVLVQSVLSDRFVGSYIGGSLVDDDSVIYTPISTLADLHTLVRSNLKGKFKLTADIDATSACLSGGDYYNAGEGWVPIGDLDEGEGGSADSGFQGTFDGAGYTITGIKCDRPSEDYQALFGFIGTGGTVKNLEVAATILSGRSQMGGLCGGNAGLVYNCHVTGASTVSGNNTNLDYSGNIGGFVGDNDGTIRLCSAAGTVTGLRDVGGVSGDNDGILQNCWFTGDVICSVVADAGLISGDNKGFIEDVPMADIPVIKGNIYGCFGVGTVQSIDIAAIGAPPPTGNIALGVGDNRGGKISSSYAVGTVTGKNPDVAGFVGNNELGDNSLGETVDSIISNCYCEGTITPEGLLPAEGAVGGFVGKNKGGQIYNSYSASTVGGTAGVEREHVEGFCGNNSNDSLVGTISNCFFDSTLYSSGDGDEDGLSTGKSTAQLEHQATFTGWDFGTIWDINEGSEYPTLPDMPEVSDDGEGDGGGDVEGGGTPVEVFPIQIIGNNPLTGDVRPKVLPGHVIFAGICEDGVVRTPVIVEDMNFPVSRDDIADGAVGKDQLGDVSGNEILGQALGWDDTENIDVQVNDTNIHVNSSNQLAVVDDSIGRSKLGNDNGDGILGDGLSWGFGNVIEVDMSEISVSGSDLTDMVDEITIGFDNPKAYVAGRTYETDEKVEYSGDNYVSLQDANTGNTPDDFESLWWLSIAGQKVLKIEEDVPGDGLQWSANGKIEVNNGFGLNINDGTDALDVNPDDFNGDGLDYDEVTGLLSVDLSEVIAIQEDTINAVIPADYVAGTEYSVDDLVKDSATEVLYKSLQNSNTGNSPDEVDSVWWVEVGSDWYTVLEKAVTAAIGMDLDIRVFLPVKSSDIGAGDKKGKFNVRLCIGTSIAVGSTIVEGRYELPDNGNQIPVVMSVTRENITAADPYIRVQIKNDDYNINQTHVDCADKDGQFTVIVFKT